MRSPYPPDRGRVLTVFTTWPFVLALTVLLVNDGFLKQAYPGLVTGKLSDFAGIAVVALPLFAAFPRHARAIYLVFIGAFLWWKSPLSNAFIAFMNEVQPLNIGRTIDYGDLLAIAILPVCRRIATRPRPFAKAMPPRRWVVLPVLAATLFGIMATSKILPRKDFAVRAIESTAPFPRDDIGATIKQIALKRGLKLREPLPDYWQGAFEGHGILLTYTFRDADEVVVGIQADPGMFGNGEIRKAEALRDEIKKTLSLRFKNLEYSDSLRPR